MMPSGWGLLTGRLPHLWLSLNETAKGRHRLIDLFVECTIDRQTLAEPYCSDGDAARRVASNRLRWQRRRRAVDHQGRLSEPASQCSDWDNSATRAASESTDGGSAVAGAGEETRDNDSG